MCGRYHHPLLHQAHLEGVISSNIHFDKLTREKTLLMVSNVYSKGIPITTLWDPGSDMTIITYEMASRLGLKVSQSVVFPRLCHFDWWKKFPCNIMGL